jgi:hypothetical protein
MYYYCRVNTGVLLAGGIIASSLAIAVAAPSTDVVTADPQPGCNDWPGVQLTYGECQAAGTIRFVALTNLQGAIQFCKWRGANPGEWSRIQGYAETEVLPTNIITWLGGSIKNELEAYFVTGAPTFTILPNTAPNACTGKLVAAPVITGVTPGETDATVTIAP